MKSEVLTSTTVSSHVFVVVYPLLTACLGGGGGGSPFMLFYGVLPPASPARDLAGMLRRGYRTINNGIEYNMYLLKIDLLTCETYNSLKKTLFLNTIAVLDENGSEKFTTQFLT